MLKITYPTNHPIERKYINSIIIKDFLGFDFEELPAESERYTISHSSDRCNREINIPDLFFSKAEFDLPKLPLDTYKIPKELSQDTMLEDVDSLPIIFGTKKKGTFFTHNPGSLTLPIDIFGSAFFMLSRYEEVVNKCLDKHHRFPAKNSIAFKSGFLEYPIIDQYVELLWLAIKKLWPFITRRRQPGKIRVSCDVDVPYSTQFKKTVSIIKTIGGDILKRRSLKKLNRSLQSIIENINGTYHDPIDTFDWYLATCEKYNRKATFYFIAGHSGGTIDGCYSLNELIIQNLLKKISSHGHEIGLHGSYNTYDNVDNIFNERSKLIAVCKKLSINAPIIGNRQHFLRWDTAQTPDHLEQAGFEYDETGSYADMPGFRYGTSRPFRMWSWRKKTALNLIQRPLIVMECSVIDDRYLGLGYSDHALNKMLKLKKNALQYGGDFSILWHNSHLLDEDDCVFFEKLISD